MRSILVFADRTPAMEPRLQSALALGRATSGHVSVLVDTPVAHFVAADGLGGAFVPADVIREAVERDDSYAKGLATRLQADDVPFDVSRAEDEPGEALGLMARLADVIVLNRECPAVEDVVVQARVPVLLVSNKQAEAFPPEVACVAWDGSVEAGVALRAAVPLLQQAGQVHVLSVGAVEDGLPAGEALRYLARHGVKAELREVARHGSVAAALAAEVAGLSASLLVMGAFGHSRLREFLLGGVTRHFLEHEQGPMLFLAH
jgi:nucleotide-binding universal stress UspA family protein